MSSGRSQFLWCHKSYPEAYGASTPVVMFLAFSALWKKLLVARTVHVGSRHRNLPIQGNLFPPFGVPLNKYETFILWNRVSKEIQYLFEEEDSATILAQ